MPDNGMLLRQGLALASGIAYWAGVAVEARRVGKRIGRSPNLRPRGTRERLLWLAWTTVATCWIGQPLVMAGGTETWLLRPAGGLVGAWSLALGAALVALGQAGTYWCYLALGDSWRMGVRKRERTALVTNGPYRFVRHPIYAFQIFMVAGVAALLPTALSAAALALLVATSSAKARGEEAYLSGAHGEAYLEYKARTGRFLPRLTTAAGERAEGVREG